ncbi:MAG: hypothetical protein PUD47_08225, partial [Bacteroidales bacterium]|nr:hypothetical protein [Bacteroidales bacterium]
IAMTGAGLLVILLLLFVCGSVVKRYFCKQKKTRQAENKHSCIKRKVTPVHRPNNSMKKITYCFKPLDENAAISHHTNLQPMDGQDHGNALGRQQTQYIA